MNSNQTERQQSEQTPAPAELLKEVEQLERTLTDLLEKGNSRVSTDLYDLYSVILYRCKRAFPDNGLVSDIPPPQPSPLGGHFLDAMLGSVRLLKVAFPPPPSPIPAWKADLHATGRTLRRFAGVCLWPVILLDHRLRVEQWGGPILRTLIRLLEALLYSAAIYLLARFGLNLPIPPE